MPQAIASDLSEAAADPRRLGSRRSAASHPRARNSFLVFAVSTGSRPEFAEGIKALNSPNGSNPWHAEGRLLPVNHSPRRLLPRRILCDVCSDRSNCWLSCLASMMGRRWMSRTKLRRNEDSLEKPWEKGAAGDSCSTGPGGPSPRSLTSYGRRLRIDGDTPQDRLPLSCVAATLRSNQGKSASTAVEWITRRSPEPNTAWKTNFAWNARSLRS